MIPLLTYGWKRMEYYFLLDWYPGKSVPESLTCAEENHALMMNQKMYGVTIAMSGMTLY